MRVRKTKSSFLQETIQFIINRYRPENRLIKSLSEWSNKRNPFYLHQNLHKSCNPLFYRITYDKKAAGQNRP
jgi:hypothetical protein